MKSVDPWKQLRDGAQGQSSDEGGYDTRLKREELDLIFEDSIDEDAVAGDGDDC